MIPEEPEAYLETKMASKASGRLHIYMGGKLLLRLTRSTHMSYRLAPGGYERTREECLQFRWAFLGR